MVTRAARYVVVVDENRVVGFDVTTGINFQIPQNCYLAAPSILTWMMDVKLLNSVASLNVLINNVQIYNGTYTTGRYGPIHEVVNPSVLKWGKNTIDFNFTNSGTVSITISDIVLWIEVAV